MHEGEDLLSKLKKMQENAYDQSVQFIEHFNISFHDFAFKESVNEIVEILDKPKHEEKIKT